NHTGKPCHKGHGTSRARLSPAVAHWDSTGPYYTPPVCTGHAARVPAWRVARRHSRFGLFRTSFYSCVKVFRAIPALTSVGLGWHSKRPPLLGALHCVDQELPTRRSMTTARRLTPNQL